MQRDLQNPKSMYLKAALFVLLGCMSASLLLADQPTLRTAVLIVLTVWSFSRAYYFAFYVIEKYIDPEFRFAGIASALRHAFARKRESEQSAEPPE